MSIFGVTVPCMCTPLHPYSLFRPELFVISKPVTVLGNSQFFPNFVFFQFRSNVAKEGNYPVRRQRSHVVFIIFFNFFLFSVRQFFVVPSSNLQQFWREAAMVLEKIFFYFVGRAYKVEEKN